MFIMNISQIPLAKAQGLVPHFPEEAETIRCLTTAHSPRMYRGEQERQDASPECFLQRSDLHCSSTHTNGKGKGFENDDYCALDTRTCYRFDSYGEDQF